MRKPYSLALVLLVALGAKGATVIAGDCLLWLAVLSVLQVIQVGAAL
ncbi:MAG TPA: hypothetical protein VN901_28525 [Candidatus Acidoferrales bacterium]|nr:hypothetical protein [Candidatus Acidoferrales bacterium]